MYVTITSLKLRNLWGFFTLSWWALKILQQLKTEQGFVAIKKSGIGRTHFTITLWQTQADLKRFAHSGSHQQAMKASSSLATEIKTLTYSSETMPDWPTAKKLLLEKGKTLSFR